MEETIQNLLDKIEILMLRVDELEANQPPRLRIKTDTGDFASGVSGDFAENRFDNNLKGWLDGAWRTIVTW